MKTTLTSKLATAAVSTALLLGVATPAFAQDVSVTADVTAKARIGAGMLGKAPGREVAFAVRQTRISVAARRASAVADMLTAMSVKLKVRIDEAKTAGKDVTAATSAYADMTTKITEAKTQASAAASAAASIKTDASDAATIEANTAALKKAREALLAAEKALMAAAKDARSIVNAFVGLKIDAKTAAKTDAGTSASAYAMTEVSSHNSVSSCWTTVGANVYDLTSWIAKHPGGEQAILGLCGTDGTAAFTRMHGSSKKAQSVLATFKVGVVK